VAGCDQSKSHSTNTSSISKTVNLDHYCTAAISFIMNKEPEELHLLQGGNNENLLYLSYIRLNDMTLWDYKCKVGHNGRVLWGDINGRWRDSQGDPVIKVVYNDGETLKVEENHGGEVISKEYSIKRLGGADTNQKVKIARITLLSGEIYNEYCNVSRKFSIGQLRDEAQFQTQAQAGTVLTEAEYLIANWYAKVSSETVFKSSSDMCDYAKAQLINLLET